VDFPFNHVTREMYSGAPSATGNHVTGSDQEQVRGTASMPAKKRLTLEYREMTSQDSHFKPTPTWKNRPFDDPPPSGCGFSGDERQADDKHKTPQPSPRSIDVKNVFNVF